MGCTSSRSEITTPIQSPTGLSQAEGQAKAFTTIDRRPSQSKSKTSPAVAPAPDTKSANQQAKYLAIFDAKPDFTKEVIMEHFMPYEFPICPVITSESQRLVVDSWKNIVGSEYESEDVASGKVSGATYFYNQFFDQLFARLRDFERIFPNIKARADIISHVMAMITSVRAENLDFMKLRLKALGHKHIQIVMDPWLFGIYTTTIHTTVRLCLDEDATPEIMNAWLHVLAFILRNMLPHYFGDCSTFGRWYEGATNSAPAMNNAAHEEIKLTEQIKALRSGTASTKPAMSTIGSRGSCALPAAAADRSTNIDPSTVTALASEKPFASGISSGRQLRQAAGSIRMLRRAHLGGGRTPSGQFDTERSLNSQVEAADV